nr:unnamed protein product [Haemonchus contortus]
MCWTDHPVKRSCGRDKSLILAKKTEAKNAAERGDSKTIHRIGKELTGSLSNVNMLIKGSSSKLLLSADELSEKWLEHFRNIPNQLESEKKYRFDVMASTISLTSTLAV